MHPEIFRIPLPFLNTSLAFTWYGLSIVLGILAATTYATYAARKRGEDPNHLWDMLIYIIVFGVVGARLWYVITATWGGSRVYLQNPLEILHIGAGGINIFGALVVGALTVFVFCKLKRLNPWLYLDFLGPGVLLGQCLARWGNYVNQELYGPPTTLPWGIPIDAQHRLPAWRDMTIYPPSTRFHPTFLYETVYDLIAFAILFYLIRRLGDRWKPGAIFGAYLILHGLGRFMIEFFRPDQPRIAGTDISYSRLLAALFMAIGATVVCVAQRRRNDSADA